MAFKPDLLAKVDKRGDGVEKPARARSQRRVQPARQHRFQCGQFRCGKDGERRKVFLLENFCAKNLIKQSERGAPRLFHGLVPARQTERTEVSDPFDAFVRDEEKLATPNRAVQTIARSIP